MFIDGSPSNTIGGLTSVPGTAPGNLISGNAQSGVLIYTPAPSALANNNFVLGNLIGTDVSGTQSLGNGSDGVQIVNSSNNFIGMANARNVISSGAANGVEIDSLTLSNGSNTPASFNILNGNYIGLTRDGTAALGNGQNGVLVVGAGNSVAIGNIIGQTDAGFTVFPGTDVPSATGNGTSGNGNVISGNGTSGSSSPARPVRPPSKATTSEPMPTVPAVRPARTWAIRLASSSTTRARNRAATGLVPTTPSGGRIPVWAT